jgi:hypothetical protein
MRLKAAELVPPPIDNDLHAILSDMGATISGDGTVQTFGNDVESLEAAESSVAVCFPSLLCFFFLFFCFSQMP